MENDAGGTQNVGNEEVIEIHDTVGMAVSAKRGRRSAAKWFSGVGSAVGVGLFLAGSAALGGIAMVLWNRRLLSEIRRAPVAEPEQYTLFDE